MIATKDIARAAAHALAGPTSSRTRILPLHGPRDYSYDEAAGIIGKAIGSPVKHVKVSPEQARQALVGMGLNAAMADLLLEMYAAIESGYLKDDHPRTAQTTTPTTFEEFAKTVLAPALQAAPARAAA